MRDQRRGAARRQVEPAQQLLPARLGGAVQLGRGDVGGRLAARPRSPRSMRCAVGTEPVRQRLEEGDARPGRQLGEVGEDVAGERDAGGLAAHRHQLLAQVDEALRALRRPRAGRGCARPAPARAPRWSAAIRQKTTCSSQSRFRSVERSQPPISRTHFDDNIAPVRYRQNRGGRPQRPPDHSACMTLYERIFNAWSVVRSPRAGARPHPGRAVGRPDPGRSRRRRDQGRAQGHGRRHPRLGAAVHRGQGRPASRRRLFPRHQPRQALDRGRLRDRGRQAHRQEARGALGRPDRELQGRRARQVRARLQEPRARVPAADLLLGHGLRPGRPLCVARRLRPDGAGHGRVHEPHRHGRTASRRGPACRCPTSSPASIR